MKTLKIEIEAEDTNDFAEALEYASKKIREGYSMIDLSNENIQYGACEITEYK